METTNSDEMFASKSKETSSLKPVTVTALLVSALILSSCSSTSNSVSLTPESQDFSLAEVDDKNLAESNDDQSDESETLNPEPQAPAPSELPDTCQELNEAIDNWALGRASYEALQVLSKFAQDGERFSKKADWSNVDRSFPTATKKLSRVKLGDDRPADFEYLIKGCPASDPAFNRAQNVNIFASLANDIGGDLERGSSIRANLHTIFTVFPFVYERGPIRPKKTAKGLFSRAFASLNELVAPAHTAGAKVFDEIK